MQPSDGQTGETHQPNLNRYATISRNRRGYPHFWYTPFPMRDNRNSLAHVRVRCVRLRVPCAACRLPPCRLRVGNVYHIACKAAGGRAENPPRTRTDMLIYIVRRNCLAHVCGFGRCRFPSPSPSRHPHWIRGHAASAPSAMRWIKIQKHARRNLIPHMCTCHMHV